MTAQTFKGFAKKETAKMAMMRERERKSRGRWKEWKEERGKQRKLGSWENISIGQQRH